MVAGPEHVVAIRHVLEHHVRRFVVVDDGDSSRVPSRDTATDVPGNGDVIFARAAAQSQHRHVQRGHRIQHELQSFGDALPESMLPHRGAIAGPA